MKKRKQKQKEEMHRTKCISVVTHHVTLVTTMSGAPLFILSLSCLFELKESSDTISWAKMNMYNTLKYLGKI